VSTDGRILIVNADDFGFSESVNAGVIKGWEEGIITSASLMVRWPAAEDAAGYARANPSLGVGLHVDLGEWIWRDDEWAQVYRVVALEDVKTVVEEVDRQLERFRALVGRDPTHLDSHQHVHVKHASASEALDALARDLGLPLRHRVPEIRYRGDLYGQTEEGGQLEAITVDRMVAILAELPGGITELGCHPGVGIDTDSSYGAERETELDVLCNARVRSAIDSEGIELRSFVDALAA
jgi:chitin disaccharide deacetylase